MATYKGSKLLPVQKLALQVFGWAVLCGLSFFFHVIAFVVVILAFAYKINEFKFVYDNTKGFPYESKSTDTPYSPYEQDLLGGAEFWPEREGSLRKNLPES